MYIIVTCPFLSLVYVYMVQRRPPPTPPPWWGTFGSMRRGVFFHHKIHIKHQDLSQKDGRYDMVMLMTWV